MRLAKYLAHAGVASRRAAEGLIAEGRVTVGGETVTDPARDVDERSGVEVDGEPVAPEPREVHLLNKPAGVVSTAQDTHGRPTVVELVASERRLYPVGPPRRRHHRPDPADQRRRAGRAADAPALRGADAPTGPGARAIPRAEAPCERWPRGSSSTTAAPRPPRCGGSDDGRSS